jgi:hypothetical protein
MSTRLRLWSLALGAATAVTAVATVSAAAAASSAARSPASGTISLGPLPGRTEVQKGSKIVVEGTRQTGFHGTIELGPVNGQERRVHHASGRIKWTIDYEAAPYVINAPGCPTFANLTIRLVGHVKAGETTLHGRLRGRSETGDVRIAAAWTVTEVIGGTGGRPLFGPTSESTYSGHIKCKTAPGGDDDEEDDEDDD